MLKKIFERLMKLLMISLCIWQRCRSSVPSDSFPISWIDWNRAEYLHNFDDEWKDKKTKRQKRQRILNVNWIMEILFRSSNFLTVDKNHGVSSHLGRCGEPLANEKKMSQLPNAAAAAAATAAAAAATATAASLGSMKSSKSSLSFSHVFCNRFVPLYLCSFCFGLVLFWTILLLCNDSKDSSGGDSKKSKRKKCFGVLSNAKSDDGWSSSRWRISNRIPVGFLGDSWGV